MKLRVSPLKPQPNNRNISTQHGTTYRNIGGSWFDMFWWGWPSISNMLQQGGQMCVKQEGGGGGKEGERGCSQANWRTEGLTDWEWFVLLTNDWSTDWQQTEPYEFQGSWPDHFVSTPTLLPPFVVNAKEGDKASSHDKSRCLGCMHSNWVGTGRERTKSSDQLSDGEWARLTPVKEAKVYLVCFITRSLLGYMKQSSGNAPLQESVPTKCELMRKPFYET